MANGDDGYVNTGGGGSVWWDLQVSESQGINHLAPSMAGLHRPRKDNHLPFKLGGVDKYTELIPGRPGHVLNGQPVPPNHPDVLNQGQGYYVVEIVDASQIQRVEIGPNNTMRLYLPIDPTAPQGGRPEGQRGPRQVTLKWGLRSRNAVMPGGVVAIAWNAVRDWLLANGAVDTAVAGTIEAQPGPAGV